MKVDQGVNALRQLVDVIDQEIVGQKAYLVELHAAERRVQNEAEAITSRIADVERRIAALDSAITIILTRSATIKLIQDELRYEPNKP